MAQARGVAPAIQLTRLEVFVAVVEAGGVTKAALRLDLAQPTVSFHMRELERSFGTKLITSRGPSVRLTEAGEVVYEMSKRILYDANAMVQRVDAIVKGAAGRLKVGVALSLEGPWLYRAVLRPFLNKQAGVHVFLRSGLSIALCEQVAAGELDMGYVVSLVVPPGVVFEPLHEEDLLFLVAPDHPLARRDTITPQELANSRFIVPSQGLAGRGEYEAVLRLSGFPPGTNAVELDSGEGWIQAARAGLGVATVYRPAAEEEITQGTLTALPVASRRGLFGLVYRADAYWTPLMTSFADHIRRAAGARLGARGKRAS